MKIVRGIGEHFSSKQDLLDENDRVRKENSELSLEISRIDDVNAENGRLRELLELKERVRFKTVAAEIIAREPNDWTGSFVIDQGAADGIMNQSAVCSARGLLGKVVETTDDTSFVLLLTSPNFKAGGVIKENRINGVIVGGGKGLARMLYIPIDAEVEPGFTVETSELSRIYPEGILIGKIISVNRSKTGLYKYAVIEPFGNFYDEEEVLCVVEKN